MGDAYPFLKDAAALLAKVVCNEEERFRETLEHGLQLLEEELARLSQSNEQTIQGEFIFKLYDTYGFPFDIVRDIAKERLFWIDEAGFHAAMEDQRLKSRSSRKGEGVRLREEGVKILIDAGLSTAFVGYETLQGISVVQGLLDAEGEVVKELTAGQIRSPYCRENTILCRIWRADRRFWRVYVGWMAWPR